MLDDESLMLLKNPTYVSVTDALGEAPMSGEQKTFGK